MPSGLMQQKQRGLFGGSVRQSPMAPAAPEQIKAGFDWGKLIGVLGDSLSIAGGGQASYVPMMQERRQSQDARAYAEQQYQRRRDDDWTDWQRQEQWKRDNPAPVNNDTVNDFEWYKGLNPADRKMYHDMRPEFRQGADGRFYRVEIAPSAPQVGAEEDGYRFKGGDPADQRNWELLSGGVPPISAAPRMATEAELAKARAEGDAFLRRNGMGNR